MLLDIVFPLSPDKFIQTEMQLWGERVQGSDCMSSECDQYWGSFILAFSSWAAYIAIAKESLCTDIVR